MQEIEENNQQLRAFIVSDLIEHNGKILTPEIIDQMAKNLGKTITDFLMSIKKEA